MKKVILIVLLLVSVLLIICTLTGCKTLFTPFGMIVVEDEYALTEIKGEVKCRFRVGETASYEGMYVKTDATFDKDEYVKLFNEFNQYDPVYLRYHLDQCNLKINPETQRDLLREIFNNQVYIKAIFDDTYRGVSVYKYDSKLYFYVLSMGENSEPDEVGEYFIELSEESDDYWRPIIEQVIQDNKNG